MDHVTRAFGVGLLLVGALAPQRAAAECPTINTEGYTPNFSCKMDDGRQGHMDCVPEWGDPNGEFKCVPSERLVSVGDANASYLILTVVYSPPGSSNCSSVSSVKYGSGSSLGSTVGMKKSLKDGVSASVSVGKEGFASGSVEFSYAATDEHSDEITLKRAEGYTIELPGPCQDGIDHNQDVIYVWLGPAMSVTTDESAGCRNVNRPCDGPPAVSWGMQNVGEVQYVTVGELKNPDTIRPGVLERFQAYNLTGDDYAKILGADPLAYYDPSSTDVPDLSRFKSIGMSIPYEPPLNSSDPIPKFSHDATYTRTETHEATSTYEYSVEVKLSANIASFASLSLDKNWTWTNSNSESNSTETTDMASVTVMAPGVGYNGPTAVNVYYDTIYKSFAFVPATLP